MQADNLTYDIWAYYTGRFINISHRACEPLQNNSFIKSWHEVNFALV